MATINSRHKKLMRIRSILNSHFVDLQELSISCSLKSMTLSGILLKRDFNEFTPHEVVAMTHELQRVVSRIYSNLENWDLNGGSIKKIPLKNHAQDDDGANFDELVDTPTNIKEA